MKIKMILTLDSGDIITCTEDTIESVMGIEMEKHNALVRIIHGIKALFER